MTKPTLALVMNVYNEEAMIAGAIASASGVDEIIVADMESTDQTVAIATAMGAKVISLPHSGFCESGRQEAIDVATADWCLVLDGDERLSEDGIEEIRSLIANTPEEISAYLLPFHTYIGETRIMATGWEADKFEYHERLFRRNDISWPTKIHGNPIFSAGKAHLPDAMKNLFVTHFNFASLTHMLDKFNRYTNTEAQEIIDSGRQASLVKGLRDGFAEVISRYSPDEDGPMSLALSFSMLHYRITTQFKAMELQGWKSADAPPSKDVMTQAVTIFWNALGIAWLQEQRSRVHEKLNETSDVAAAMRELRRLLEVFGNEATLLCDLGTLEYSSGNPDAALEHLQAAVALKPDFEDAVRNRDAVLQSIGAARVVRAVPRR